MKSEAVRGSFLTGIVFISNLAGVHFAVGAVDDRREVGEGVGESLEAAFLLQMQNNKLCVAIHESKR